MPFLGGFVALLLRRGRTARSRSSRFILVTIASDIGGYAVGVVAGKHPMAPVISPKKSWEGFAGSAVSCVVVGWLSVGYLLDGDWWVGVLLGLDRGRDGHPRRPVRVGHQARPRHQGHVQIIPGHGGLMDRLDSLLATAAPTWLLLHYLVF